MTLKMSEETSLSVTFLVAYPLSIRSGGGWPLCLTSSKLSMALQGNWHWLDLGAARFSGSQELVCLSP